MKRIIWHWTGGAGRANASDARRYAFVIEADGAIVRGIHPPEVNLSIPHGADMASYYAHTARANTGAIGVALAGMRRAVERPFDPGPDPITPAQIDALARLTARLARDFAIPLTRETMLSHAEVGPTLGINQAGKWDITWIPDTMGPADPVAVGDILRGRVAEILHPKAPAKPVWRRRFEAYLPRMRS